MCASNVADSSRNCMSQIKTVSNFEVFENARLMCKRCGCKFTDQTCFERMKHNSRVIVLAMDLYFKGLSYRKISEICENREVQRVPQSRRPCTEVWFQVVQSGAA